MDSFVTLRPAMREDAAELAILVDMASAGFASWLWLADLAGAGSDTPTELGRRKMRRDEGPGNWKDTVLAEAYGEVAGAAIGYGLGEGIRGMQTDRPALAPVIDLQKMVIGSWFNGSLAVYRHLCGMGIGQRLADDQIEKAQGLPVSLIAASDNDKALALYKKNGFSEKAREKAEPLFEGSRKHEWVLLARDAR
jgi:ribosomal protein S18 acetylase RimI-like enzyme